MSAKVRIVFAGVGIVVLSCSCILTISRELHAARPISAEIRLDGKVLLKGSASDNGQQDADEVWRSLSTVRFRPTDEGQKWVAESDSERRLLEGQVTVHLAFGGTADVRRFEVVRTHNKDSNFDWMVEPELVKKLFLIRHIPRLHVRLLKDVNAKE